MVKRQEHSPLPVRLAFAARLEKARRKAGYETQRAFAQALGMTEGRQDEAYGRWERGETEPGLFQLQKIAQLTGLSLDHLVLGLPERALYGGTGGQQPDRGASTVAAETLSAKKHRRRIGADQSERFRRTAQGRKKTGTKG